MPRRTAADADRLAHLETLALLVHRFVEQARAIDARYDQQYTDMAEELRALGYQVRADIPAMPRATVAPEEVTTAMTPQQVQALLVTLKGHSIADRLQLLRATFPEVVADAERFLSHFWGMPYELVFIDAVDPDAVLQEQYDIAFGRHRPDVEDVSPRTDLLYEACELLMAHPPDRDKLLAELKRRAASP